MDKALLKAAGDMTRKKLKPMKMVMMKSIMGDGMDKFIEQNGLIKRQGLNEWYSVDGQTRLVKLGDRYRLDVKIKNWSAFKSDYIVGHREREFKSVVGRRRHYARSPRGLFKSMDDKS